MPQQHVAVLAVAQLIVSISNYDIQLSVWDAASLLYNV